jgi:hypothetical protein
MFITIINDCRDSNAVGRQATRVHALFGTAPTFVGVGSDIEAAGNLVDVLAAGEGEEGIVLVNVAPRNGEARKWGNGTPFGWFRYRKTLVVSSIDGLTLSLIRKLRLAERVHVLAEAIPATQFRSYEYLPKAAKRLWDGETIPHRQLPIDELQEALPAVWFVDNFGNCKTTVLAGEAETAEAPSVAIGGEVIPRFRALKDVPDAASALIVGSSGLGARRFLEIVVQGGNAARRFGLRSGDRVNYFSATPSLLRPSEV